MPRNRTVLPTLLTDPVQRGSLAAELHTLADEAAAPCDADGQGLEPTRLELARAARLRTWAVALDGYGAGNGAEPGA